MKIIHTADLHLGSALSELPAEKRERRAEEIAGAFRRTVSYARDNGIKLIMLCGDVFDGDRPRKADRDFFYGVIESNPDIDFLYLRGNHDTDEEFIRRDIANLKTFSTEWTSYDYGEAVISGVELPAGDCSAALSVLKLERDRFNIVMLHGPVSASVSTGGDISLPLLRDKGIDYLALGHFHSYKADALDERGIYVYSGCPEGRGYDECGDKGFVILDTFTRQFTFHKTATRAVTERTADISLLSSVSEVLEAISGALEGTQSGDIARVVLTGKTELDIPALRSRIEGYFAQRFFHFEIKDKTERRAPAEDYSRSASLKGEFYRLVTADESLSDDEKSEIIALGIKALNMEEI